MVYDGMWLRQNCPIQKFGIWQSKQDLVCFSVCIVVVLNQSRYMPSKPWGCWCSPPKMAPIHGWCNNNNRNTTMRKKRSWCWTTIPYGIFLSGMVVSAQPSQYATTTHKETTTIASTTATIIIGRGIQASSCRPRRTMVMMAKTNKIDHSLVIRSWHRSWIVLVGWYCSRLFCFLVWTFFWTF